MPMPHDGGRLVQGLPVPHAPGAHGACRRPVVAEVSGEDLVLARVARLPMVLPGHLESGLGGFGPAAHQARGVQIPGGDLGQQRGQLHRPRIGSMHGGIERQGLDLAAHRLHQPGVVVPDVHHVDPRQAIQVLLPLDIPEPDAIGAGHDEGLLDKLRHLPVIEHDVAKGVLGGVTGIGVGWHDPSSIPIPWVSKS